MTLEELNHLPVTEARRVLLQCCGSRRWVQAMAAARPFVNVKHLLHAADTAGEQLGDADWLEAFAAHPRIGEHSSSSWSQTEQAAALNAEKSVKTELLRRNAEYERKYGFIFIVFASGKTPDQVLTLIEQRMRNDRSTELANAAAEQRQITRARLHKLLEL